MSAAEYLVEKGFDLVFGTRPLKRLIQNEILDELPLRIIEGEMKDGDRLTIDAKNNGITMTKK